MASSSNQSPDPTAYDAPSSHQQPAYNEDQLHSLPWGSSNPVEPAPFSFMKSHSSSSLAGSLHRFPWNLADDDDEELSMRGRWRTGTPDHRRHPSVDERRVTQILSDPQMRSMMLIGSGNSKFQWRKYWKSEAELKTMTKPIRKYYERTNDLVRQYMFIDTLLDSSIPHELLNEYSARLDASAYRPVEVPQTIQEEGPSTDTSAAATPSRRSSLVTPSASLAKAPNGNGNSNGNGKRVCRTRKDIFRSSETTPLLSAPRDEEEALGGGGGGGEVVAPYTPWLEKADLDHDDPVVTLAIYVNTIANVVLLVAKIIVVASVPSISVLASLVDAVLDFLSTAVVWTTTKLISASQKDQNSYPVGRRKLEPVGVLVFSVIMITSFTQVGMESISRLMSPNREVLELGLPAILVLLSTVVIKGVLWFWCRLVRNSSVRALADDAVTDVIFNTGSIIFPILGFYGAIWWFDAMGGLVLSLAVIANWSITSLHHVRNLTGFSADPDERNLLLYLTMRFATAIKQIQNLRAYHAGDKLFVEVDIILEANTPLKDSHDLSEVLTYFLESVPIVDRAFVHVDYDSYNVPTHVGH